jgi:alpha-L-fucosidase
VRRARPITTADQPFDLRVERRGDDVHVALGLLQTWKGEPPIDDVYVLDIAGEPDVTIPPVVSSDAPIFVGSGVVRVTTDRKNVQVRYTTDGSEPAEASPEVTGAITLTRTATVKARVFRGPRAVSGVTAATFTRVQPRPAEQPAGVLPGLDVDVVEGEFTALPGFSQPQIAKTTTAQDFDLSVRPRDTAFALRYRGYVRAPATGVYHFFLTSDDGSRMWVGETPLIDNDGPHGAKEVSAPVALEAGWHPITVGMFQATGGLELQVSWSGPGIPKARVPAGALGRLK